MSRYGRELTKEQLIASGITEITPEGRVFRGEIEVNMTKTANGYLVFSIYDRDEKGNFQNRNNNFRNNNQKLSR